MSTVSDGATADARGAIPRLLRHAVPGIPSIARSIPYPSAREVAVTRGVSIYGNGGSSRVRARSSIHTLPFPPVPAVIAISIANTRRSVLSAIGPHANEICRFFRVTVVHSRGKTKLVVFDHQTFSPVESTILNSSVLTGASPRMANENS